MQILSSYGLSVVQFKTDSDLRNSIQQQHQAQASDSSPPFVESACHPPLSRSKSRSRDHYRPVECRNRQNHSGPSRRNYLLWSGSLLLRYLSRAIKWLFLSGLAASVIYFMSLITVSEVESDCRMARRGGVGDTDSRSWIYGCGDADGLLNGDMLRRSQANR